MESVKKIKGLARDRGSRSIVTVYHRRVVEDREFKSSISLEVFSATEMQCRRIENA